MEAKAATLFGNLDQVHNNILMKCVFVCLLLQMVTISDIKMHEDMCSKMVRAPLSEEKRSLSQEGQLCQTRKSYLSKFIQSDLSARGETLRTP